MPKRTTLIPRAPVARILYNAGAKMVSAEAAEEFAEILEDIGAKMAEQANKIAKHSGRKTIHGGDIKLAARQG